MTATTMPFVVVIIMTPWVKRTMAAKFNKNQQSALKRRLPLVSLALRGFGLGEIFHLSQTRGHSNRYSTLKR
jgi:hypothetical protein